MKKYKIYLVDFDGTIIDSFQGLMFFYSKIFASVGETVSKEEAFLFTKMSLQAAFELKVKNPTEEKFKTFCETCDEVVATRELLKYNVLFMDSLPFMNFVKDNNALLGLVTGNEATHVNMVLNNVHALEYFDTLVTTRELTHQKPHPEGILKALDRLGYKGDKKDVCYIGDAWNDFLAAKAAGVDAILLDRHNEYKENEEYILIHSLIDLI